VLVLMKNVYIKKQNFVAYKAMSLEDYINVQVVLSQSSFDNGSKTHNNK